MQTELMIVDEMRYLRIVKALSWYLKVNVGRWKMHLESERYLGFDNIQESPTLFINPKSLSIVTEQ